jgi:hypothetical protein
MRRAWFLARGPEAGRRFRMCGLLPSNHSISSFEAVSQSASPQIRHGMNLYGASVHFATWDDADLTGADR